MGMEPATQIVGEPALSFTYDLKKSLYEQFSEAQGVREGEGELEATFRRLDEDAAGMEDVIAEESEGPSDVDDVMTGGDDGARVSGSVASDVGCQFFGFPLFEGISTCKQRRKKGGSVQAAAFSPNPIKTPRNGNLEVDEIGIRHRVLGTASAANVIPSLDR